AIDLFVDYLQQALKSNPGLKLDAQELAFQSRQFKKDEKERYLIRTQKAAEAWLNKVSQDQNSEARKRAFERVLVKRFSHLFPPNESLESERAVSRRVLPGLMLALEQLAGAEFVQQCQVAGRNVLRNVREEKGGDFSWNEFYNDPAINDIVDDLMAVVAWSFRDTERRIQWLLNLINLNLAPPEDYPFEGPAIDTWTLKRSALIEMLRALFADFRDKLAGTDSRRQMERRYGQKACQAIQRLIENLDRANGH
ncbi:MAG: hypothetical protein RIB59_10200, partial [Rhodospirillales bacterium]